MRDLDQWVKDSVFAANVNIVKYVFFVWFVEWSTTWAFYKPSWIDSAFRVVAWGGLFAVVAVRFLLYYAVEREMKRYRQPSTHPAP